MRHVRVSELATHATSPGHLNRESASVFAVEALNFLSHTHQNGLVGILDSCHSRSMGGSCSHLKLCRWGEGAGVR